MKVILLDEAKTQKISHFIYAKKKENSCTFVLIDWMLIKTKTKNKFIVNINLELILLDSISLTDLYFDPPKTFFGNIKNDAHKSF